MVNTVHNVLLSHRFHGLGDKSLMSILYIANKLLGPVFFEVVLHFREDQLYRIKFGAIAPVENVSETELIHSPRTLWRFVGAELIHKQADLVFAVDFSQFCQPLFEFGHIDGPRKNLEIFLAFFRRNGR